MKRIIAFLLVAMLLFAASCAPSSGSNTGTPVPQKSGSTSEPTSEPSVNSEDSTNLVPLLSMNREEVTALYGSGEPVPFADIGDFNETAFALNGFPCEYSELNGTMIFYDAAFPADDASPYYCIEDPTDRVLGILLPQGSAPFNVNGATSEYPDSYGATIEYINGLYEYYEAAIFENDIYFVWRSDYPEMVETVLYASSEQMENEYVENGYTATDYAENLVLIAPNLVDLVELISSDSYEDGTYREELLFDSMISIVTERLAGVDYTEEAVASQIEYLNIDGLADLYIEQDSALSEQLTYPAWRVTYATGTNEDARNNLDIYIQTEGWDFRFHTATPADAYADYSDIIESWIESLYIAEMD